ncbi:MAG: lamin tail domain-containing protein [Saprospiraceae bacterium]|nr:lamin tail domain-containing protein [Saprospiraceae bacterium]
MKKILTLFCFIISLLALDAQIVITEIMYNPPESGTDYLEYIEFQNTGNTPVNMNNYKIPDAVVFTFPDTVISPGSFIVVCVDSLRLDSIFNIQALEWTSGGMRNTDEVITLLNANGEFVDSVHYFSSWSPQTNGDGSSLELCRTTADNSLAVYWRPSLTNAMIEVNAKAVYGSPGKSNNVICAEHSINLQASSFDPADISIFVGEQVEWINTSGTHNVNGNQSIFRDNPASFYSGNPKSGNWSFIYKFDLPGTYEYQCDIHGPSGMTGVVRVRNKDINYPDITIDLLKTTNQNGVMDSFDRRYTVEGTVYGVNLRPAGLQFTIIDKNNQGIGVFLSAGNLNYTVKEGDLLRIKGLATQFNGLAQIVLDSLQILSTGANLFAASIVTDLNENTESQLIQIKNVELVDPITWTNNPLGFTAKITNGIQEFDLRIDNDVNIHGTMPPTGKFNITGIGSQFDASSPYFDNYQIIPRYLQDLELITATDNSLAPSTRLRSTIVTNSIEILTTLHYDDIEIINQNGVVQWNGKFVRQLQFDLLPGIYFLKLKGQRNFIAKFVKL